MGLFMLVAGRLAVRENARTVDNGHAIFGLPLQTRCASTKKRWPCTEKKAPVRNEEF